LKLYCSTQNKRKWIWTFTSVGVGKKSTRVYILLVQLQIWFTILIGKELAQCQTSFTHKFHNSSRKSIYYENFWHSCWYHLFMVWKLVSSYFWININSFIKTFFNVSNKPYIYQIKRNNRMKCKRIGLPTLFYLKEYIF
jgi:hypothetical protein